MRTLVLSLGLLLVPGLAARDAAAEFVITGNAGSVFGGDTDERHTTFGLGLGYFSDSLFGFEVDATYTPDFFGGEESGVPDNSLTTAMANIVLSGRFGEDSRLYASAGAGIMKSNVGDADDLFDLGSDDFGANVGAGLIFGIGEKAGLRADVRYFRNLTGEDDAGNPFDVDFGDFDYWRASGGLSLRF